jgi:hypothetical protein
LPLVKEFCHPDELDAVTDDVVVTSTKLVGAGRGSGVPVELEMAAAMELADA